MAGTALSSLRVTSDFDATAYSRGAQQKVAADAQMIASDRARNASLAQVDAAMAKSVPGMASLSKSLLDGYSAGQQFTSMVQRIGNAVDRGMSLDRANTLLDATYRKFGLTADAVSLAERGFVSIAPAVDALNQKYAVMADVQARVQASQDALTRAQQAQAAINSVTGVSSPSAASQGATTTALEESFNRQLTSANALRAALNPLEAEMGRLGTQMASYKKMVDDGIITQDEYAAAQVLAGKRLTDFEKNLKDGATAGRVMSGELVNLSYQLNDVITGILLGQSPFMIFAQQGSQIFQIFQSSKASVLDFAATAGSKLLGFFTVARLVFGGITAAILAAVTATNSYVNGQNAVTLGLAGSGRASGATQNSINGIAQAGSSSSGFSVSEARTFATTLASTGKIANDNILPIVQMGKDISRVFGTDAADAAKMLADAFADPARGADQLNQRLGFLDAATKQNITNLIAQNNLYQAQIVLMRGVQSSLAGVGDATANTTKFWTSIGNAISNAWDGLGGFLASMTNLGQSTETQLQRAQQRLEALKDTSTDYSQGFAITTAGSPEEIARAQAEVDRLTDALNRLKKASEDARNAQQSFANAAAIRSALPLVNQVETLQNQLTLLQGLLVGGFADDSKLRAAGTSLDQVARAIAAVSAQLKSLPQQELVNMLGSAASPAEKLSVQLDQIRQKAAQIGASTADTNRAIGAAQLDTAAQEQSARINALGQSASVLDLVKQKELALRQAQLAGANLTPTQIQQQVDLARANANGTLQMKAQTDQTNIQTAAIGMSTAAAAEFTARMNLLAEAARNHKVLTADDIAAINAQAKALGDAAQNAQLAQVRYDVAYGRQTSLLSPDDVQIAQQLKGLYPDVATALASVEAAGLRTNQALSGISSALSNDLTNGLVDISTGAKSVSQGFADMTSAIIRDIEQMIIKITIVQPLMKSLQLGFSSIFSNPVAGITGSANGNAFTGSSIAAFAGGGAFTNKLFTTPTLFRFANGGGMSLGVMGEAGPEAVMPLRRGPNGKLGVETVGSNDNNVGYANGGIVVNIHNAPAGMTATATTSRNAKGGLQLDVVLRDSVRGVIADDLANNTGVADSLKGFVKSSGYKGG